MNHKESLSNREVPVNIIRKATLNDIPEMTKLNIACRKHNYAWIVPQDYLDNINTEKRILAREKHFLEVQDKAIYYVKIMDGKIVGFTSGGPNSDTNYPYENEIYGLYVDINYQGKWIGKELVDTLLQDEKFKMCKSFCLRTLKDNPQSNNFYQKIGGRLITDWPDKIHPRTWVQLAWYFWER